MAETIALSEETELGQGLRDAARQMLAAEYPHEHGRSEQDTVQRLQQVWKRGVEMGWLSLAEAGTEWLELLTVIVSELGAAGCPLPLADYTIAGELLRSCPEGQAASLDGVVPALALGALAGDIGGGELTVDEASGTVSGTVRFVELGGVATHVLAPVADGRWVLLPLDSPRVTVDATAGLAVPAWADIRADSAGVTLLQPGIPFGMALQWARLAVAARAHGSARRSFDLALEHAKVRRQFGGPVARFQGLQYRLVDSVIALDGQELMIRHASRAFADGEADWPLLAACAVRWTADSARAVTRASHRTLAGMGFFEEHEAPAHFRRVHADTLRWGVGGSDANDLGVALLAARGLPTADPLRIDPEFRAVIRRLIDEYQAGGGKAGYGHKADLNLSRIIGREHLIGLSWKPEFGGQGRPVRAQLAVLEELEYAGVPVDGHLVAEWLFGPLMMAHGTPEQQQRYLPRVLAGDLHICIGYTESEAGSDLSAIRSTATFQDGEWVINAAKVFTSFAEDAEICMLAARTDPDPRRGLSLFLVPMTAAGITIQPKVSFGGHPACTVFYDNVRVGPEALVGGVNNAWPIILGSFTYERLVMGSYVYDLRRAYEELLENLPESGTEDLGARRQLAALASRIVAAGLLVTRCVEDLERSAPNAAHSAIAKAFTGDLGEFFAETASEILGPTALLSSDGEGAGTGLFEWWQRDSLLNVTAGGTGDIQRNGVARQLGLPRVG